MSVGTRGAAVLAVVGALAVLAVAGSGSVASAAPRITISTPRSCQVVQRGAGGSARITVIGRVRGFAGPVQVRWGHGSWRQASRAADGSFALTLPSQLAGQAALVARSARHHEIAAMRRLVGVGDIYVIAGQSNASGRSPIRFRCADPNLQATVFGNDYRWQRLRDPVDSAEGQVDGVSRDAGAGGSVWPLVAQRLMAAEGVPVALVPCARVGTTVASWQRPAVAPREPSTLYGSMLRRIRTVGGRVRAVLFWQGEADARRLTPGDSYEASLLRLSRDLRRDCGAPLVVAQIGDYGPAYRDAGVDAVRLAQQGAWGRANVVAGPVLYDIDLEGVVHFAAADDMQVAAGRWTAAILAGVLGRSAARSPAVASVAWNGARDVTVSAAPGAEPLAPGPAGGFTVSCAGLPVAVESATVEAGGVVRLLLAKTPAGPPMVSLGAGRAGAGAPVPVESSPWRLPMVPFVKQPAIPPL